MLTKLRYAGFSIEDLLHMCNKYIITKLEYYIVVFHSSLTVQQSASLERCQAVCLSVILQDNYISQSAALELTGLDSLADRCKARFLTFTKGFSL